MTESKRKQLILDCRIYDGSEDPEFPGYYEECWIRFHDKDEAYLDAVTQEYISAGLKDFSSDDGTPISLKAVLFNRYIHWGNPYNYEEECQGFKNWYISHYRDKAPTHRQVRYAERSKNLIKRCRYYKGEIESPYEDSRKTEFRLSEKLWVDELATSFTNAETYRHKLNLYPKVKKFIASTKLPASLVGLLLCREEKWTRSVQDDLFIKGLQRNWLNE